MGIFILKLQQSGFFSSNPDENEDVHKTIVTDMETSFPNHHFATNYNFFGAFYTFSTCGLPCFDERGRCRIRFYFANAGNT